MTLRPAFPASIVVLLATMTLPSCGATGSRQQIRAQSAERWSCPRESVTVEPQGQDVLVVSGCGHRDVYVCSESGVGPNPTQDPTVGPVLAEDYKNAGGACRTWSKR